jgi:acetyl-CoA carboxylase biotin carboxyl carrier protein
VTLTAKDVAQITRLLEDSSFDEMTLELDGLKLTLRRQGVAGSPAPLVPSEPSVPPAPPSRPSQPASPSLKSAAEAAPAVESAAQDLTAQNVTAPLLGTFYRAPKPGAQPFIEVGSRVEEDTIIGIIEVMKLMNTVRAGTRGTVVDILAQDGALVEYGEVLVRVSKAIPT